MGFYSKLSAGTGEQLLTRLGKVEARQNHMASNCLWQVMFSCWPGKPYDLDIFCRCLPSWLSSLPMWDTIWRNCSCAAASRSTSSFGWQWFWIHLIRGLTRRWIGVPGSCPNSCRPSSGKSCWFLRLPKHYLFSSRLGWRRVSALLFGTALSFKYFAALLFISRFKARLALGKQLMVEVEPLLSTIIIHD